MTLTLRRSAVSVLVCAHVVCGNYTVPVFPEGGEIWRSARLRAHADAWCRTDVGFPLTPQVAAPATCVTCNVPLRRHLFSEANHTRVLTPQNYTGFPDRVDLSKTAGNDRQPYAIDATDRGLGPKIVFGNKLDQDRTSYQSLAAYIDEAEEDLAPRIYCNGARFRKSFFATATARREYLQLDNDCVRDCYLYLQNKTAESFDIIDFVHQPFLTSCRVPLVTSFTGKLVKTKFNNGPTGSLQFAASTFKNALALLRKNQLLDVMLKVHFTGAHYNVTHDPRVEAKDVSWLSSNEYDFKQRPSGFAVSLLRDEVPASAQRLTLSSILGAGRRPGANNRAKARALARVPRLSQTSRATELGRRTIESWYNEPYRFFEDELEEQRGAAQVEGELKFLAASSLEYAAFGMNNFKWPSNTGYFADRLRVVERPSAFEAVVDFGESVRRVFDASHFEFTLLSTATLLDVESTFVFHVAHDWLYYVSPSSPCTDQRTSKTCEYHRCNWCGKLQSGADWLHPGLAGYRNLQPLGNCGVPVDVCYMRRGYPTRSFRVAT